MVSLLAPQDLEIFFLIKMKLLVPTILNLDFSKLINQSSTDILDMSDNCVLSHFQSSHHLVFSHQFALLIKTEWYDMI
ncbi:hypothetical protein BLOT_008143 [Blomia tropicalis]|nr:hypothetical protein BLOT_008143 [Blomia tropicalis]